jgi:hypothetical protein
MSLCVVCGVKANNQCPCGSASYCGVQCQSKDWEVHKVDCTALGISELEISGKFKEIRYMGVFLRAKLPDTKGVTLKFIRAEADLSEALLEFDERKKVIYIHWKDSFQLRPTLARAKMLYAEKSTKSRERSPERKAPRPIEPKRSPKLKAFRPIDPDPTFAVKWPELAKWTERKLEAMYDDDETGEQFEYLSEDLLKAAPSYVEEWAQRNGYSRDQFPTNEDVLRVTDSLERYLEKRVPKLGLVLKFINEKGLFPDQTANLIDGWRSNSNDAWAAEF